MLNGKFKFYLCINISIILGYTFIYFKIFVRHCYKQKVDLYICVFCQLVNIDTLFEKSIVFDNVSLQLHKNVSSAISIFSYKLIRFKSQQCSDRILGVFFFFFFLGGVEIEEQKWYLTSLNINILWFTLIIDHNCDYDGNLVLT